MAGKEEWQLMLEDQRRLNVLLSLRCFCKPALFWQPASQPQPVARTPKRHLCITQGGGKRSAQERGDATGTGTIQVVSAVWAARV